MGFKKKLFAEALIKKQKEKKLSVRSAAKEIGISAATLSRLNRGLIVPDLDTYYNCVSWLNVDFKKFFN